MGAHVVEGLHEGGAAALLLKTHHAVMDGMAAVELLKQLFDFEPDAERGPLPPLPVPEEISPDGADSRRDRARCRSPARRVSRAGATNLVRRAGRVTRNPGGRSG